jgi:F0F1-type ATP synthase membrane subunit c/vacuolar-type H+-ATPase subunit K
VPASVRGSPRSALESVSVVLVVRRRKRSRVSPNRGQAIVLAALIEGVALFAVVVAMLILFKF